MLRASWWPNQMEPPFEAKPCLYHMLGHIHMPFSFQLCTHIYIHHLNSCLKLATQIIGFPPKMAKLVVICYPNFHQGMLTNEFA